MVIVLVFISSCSSAIHTEGRPEYGDGNAEVLFLDLSADSFDLLDDGYESGNRLIVKLIADSDEPGMAVYCAGEYGQAWNMMEILVGNGGEMDIDLAASVLAIPPGEFQECVRSGKYRDIVEEDRKDAKSYGVSVPQVVSFGR